ncbi:MAG: SDR family oxidoreductase [Chloroflexi bacterium]|nr:SDR family oxidoreductase [Chloroflexota bacterium]
MSEDRGTRLDGDLSLEGRVCLVVGGRHGIGGAISTALRDAGATVLATSRQADGGDFWPVDVTDPASVSDVAARLEAAGGRLDVLVYNSGIAGPTAALQDVTEEQWSETFEVNVTGAYRMCRAAIPWLARSGSGRIILVASMTGRRPLLHRVPYAASKTALLGFCRSLALEVGPIGITVNTISPGFVKGERIDAVLAAQAAARGLTVEQARDEVVTLSPLRQMVRPESVAYLVTMLASPLAQDMTGADFNVSAGVWMD